ncbi:hypothetical protein KBC75_05935 [Candidatus Shapirobacteria bacterium]|nr:hypothetical protein [Candidatus Shapirobacteria bacterium]
MKNMLRYYVRFCMFLTPIFFLPWAVDAYGFGKVWWLMTSMGLGLVVWMVDAFLINKKPVVRFNQMFWLMAVLVGWSLVSWFRMQTGIRMRSLVSAGGLGTMLAIWGWMFLWLQASTETPAREANLNEKSEFDKQVDWLTVAGVLVAILSVVVFVIPANKLPWVWPKNNPLAVVTANWSLAGSLISEIVLLGFLGMEWGRRLVDKMKKGDYVIEATVVGLMVLVIMLDIFKMSKFGWLALDGASAWVIAVETFKRSPIWGVGIGNFMQAFNMYRPTSYNLTPYWSSGFASSTNGLMQIWTELGLAGVILVIFGIVKWFSGNRKEFGFYRVGLIGLAGLFLPINLLGFVLLVWVLIEGFGKNEVKLELRWGKFNVIPMVISILVLLGVGVGGYWWGRMLLADIQVRSSLVAAGKNDGGSTYNLQIKAIANNPYASEYRRLYSQTNMALAKTLLTNKDASDEDKQKASVLVQQAVREAKNAIALDNLNANYWLNLADIYKQLIGVVDGAADWAFQSYQQAGSLDPVNPNTGMDLGGLLYAANRYEEADRIFEQVVFNKKDYANAWYNWAYSAKNTNKLSDAVSRLTQALSLVSVDSADYGKASKELLEWKTELDVQNKKETDSKNIPTATPSPETLKTAEPLPKESTKSAVKVPTGELEPPKE